MNIRLPERPWFHFLSGFLTATLLALIVSWVFHTPRPPSDDQVPKPEAVTETAELEPHPAEGEEVPFPEVGPVDLKRFRARNVRLTKYIIQMGDNYWSIAKQFNVSVRSLVGANPDMPFIAKVGDAILVPSVDGTTHRVEKDETLASIADLYQVDGKELKRTNGISWWSPLKTGDFLFVPDAKPVRMGDKWQKYYEKRGFFGAPFASWGKGWTSRYGMRTDPITGEPKMHGGMDFKASYGTDVFASASGKVTFTGVNGGYGNLIVIRHANQYTTYYGHLSKILVKVGETVRKGERIGKVGSTGRTTGPHLHFEIRKNGKRIDPLPLI